MNALLSCDRIKPDTISLTGSKSETNRLLILKALYQNLTIENSSNSDDSNILKEILDTNSNVVDVHHAGTAMRFLTAYFASRENKNVLLTGSRRMQERPIGILVNALRSIGATILYQDKEGYPPITIHGKILEGSEVSIPANVSSQFVSALLLVAPTLPNGLTVVMEDSVTSEPYIEMTLSLLDRLGVPFHRIENKITIRHLSAIEPTTVVVESDWSSASYFYSIVALAQEGSIRLRHFRKNSLQGDSELVSLYKNLGVETHFEDDQTICLESIKNFNHTSFEANLLASPDIAQTIAVTCFGLGIGCTLTGLHTLKIKETDRLVALKTELEKLGATVIIDEQSLVIEESKYFNANVKIKTYDDHRMAMAFAPLGMLKSIRIEDAKVVSKSYPDFWSDLQKVGMKVDLE